MGYLFRINKSTGYDETIENWSDTQQCVYNSDVVKQIQDTTTMQKEITSIPSPFARIEVVKDAFLKVAPSVPTNDDSKETIKRRLHGTTLYNKAVSDTLDVAQIFFNYESLKDRVEILVWNRNRIEDLENPNNLNAHRIFGDSLSKFLKSDAEGQDPYNFARMRNLYILNYIGQDRGTNMRIIGATSPRTLFFSTANDDSNISRHLCFGNDYAFDNVYASLDQRDENFIKYFFALRSSINNFSGLFPEVNQYLDNVYFVLKDDLKNEIDRLDGQYITNNTKPISINIDQTTIYEVEVIGHPIRAWHLSDENPPQLISDFPIYTNKTVNGRKPLVLPVVNGNKYSSLRYYGTPFGTNHRVPYYDNRALADRTLPGINTPYPYLTISDFLEDKIVKLRDKVNDAYFFEEKNTKNGYLLPITERFFDYFTVEELKNMISIKDVAADGVEVNLSVPIGNGEKYVEYNRIYNLDVKAEKENNKGAIVQTPDDFMVGVFPPVPFPNAQDANYRIAILCDNELNKQCSCKCHNEENGFFTPNWVVRNANETDDIRAKVFFVEGVTFDSARITVKTDNKDSVEKFAEGLLVPLFKKKNGVTSYSFAIDFGTSNTHIEYKETGTNNTPIPFTVESDNPQIALICKPSDVILYHLRGEFVPESIGVRDDKGNLSSDTKFPMHTVLGFEKGSTGINEQNPNNDGVYIAMGNASPAFAYDNLQVGLPYNQFVTNLKWDSPEEQVKSYIESLMLLIRNKVLMIGGNIGKTNITWFYPTSMQGKRLGYFQNIWKDAYSKYFDTNGVPTAIPESTAPYSYYKNKNSNVVDVVTIDIGGGTTDIAIVEKDIVKCLTSMRFAANAIFGTPLVKEENGDLNGIIRMVTPYFSQKLEGVDSELKKMFNEMTANNKGKSTDVASFLFSLKDNKKVKAKGKETELDFNHLLSNGGEVKADKQCIVFYIFYTSIIYHLACLMKARGLKAPETIAFSGNGSKVLNVLTQNDDDLKLLAEQIFRIVYGDPDFQLANLIINKSNPKEATCQGGLWNSNPEIADNAVKVLFGIDRNSLVEDESYNDINDAIKTKVKDEIINYWDVVAMKIPQNNKFNIKAKFGIDDNALKDANVSFNSKSLTTYITKGCELKLGDAQHPGEFDKTDRIEETLFFYPIMGVMSDLADKICKNHYPKS